MKITALIPVYSIPGYIIKTVGALASEDYPGSGIVVVIDGDTTPEIAEALRMVRNVSRVRVIDGREHMGKAAALNLAVAETDSDGILFLDNDIIIEAGMSMFSKCESALGRCDIAEIPKLGNGRGILASMAKCEFLANLLATDFLVSRYGRCPAMNGAAFIVKRSLFEGIGGFRGVVNEDMDFAARAFFAGARAGFEPSMTVKNAVSESFGVWFKQHRRWAINSPLWAQVYMPRFKKEAPEFLTGLFKSGLILPLPFFMICAAILVQFLPVSTGHSEKMLSALAGLSLFGITAFYFSTEVRKFGTRLFLPAYIFYSIFYLPLWGIAYCLGLISVLTRNIPDLGWKHDERENFVGIKKTIRRKTKFSNLLPKSEK